jgi:hypothetical protein
MISKELQQEALDLLAKVEAAAKEEGRKEALSECAAQLAEQQARFDAQLAKERQAAYAEGYNAHLAEAETATQGNNPNTPSEHSENSDHSEHSNPPTSTYSRDRAINGLLSLKGSNSHAVAIIDKYGNVHTDGKNLAISDVLGIGFTDGEHHLCMSLFKVAAAELCPDGVNFGDDVFTTQYQWRNAANKATPAFDDYDGVMNTAGFLKHCSDSLAHRCHAVIFANGRNGYMPACGELRLISKYGSEADALLKSFGKKSDGNFVADMLQYQAGAILEHTSTLCTAPYSWAVRHYSTASQPEKVLRSRKFRTRPFVEL